MGAGKTSVGRALGQRLNWVFEDLDDRLEREQGRTVAEIFRDSGEAAFRQAENKALAHVLAELQAGVPRVVALGGGAFVQPENVTLLKSSAVPTVFLDASVDDLWQRCRLQEGEAGIERPLLRSIDQFRDLYAVRREGYATAAFRIQTAGRSIEAIVDEIVQALELKATKVRTEEGEVE